MISVLLSDAPRDELTGVRPRAEGWISELMMCASEATNAVCTWMTYQFFQPTGIFDIGRHLRSKCHPCFDSRWPGVKEVDRLIANQTHHCFPSGVQLALYLHWYNRCTDQWSGTLQISLSAISASMIWTCPSIGMPSESLSVSRKLALYNYHRLKSCVSYVYDGINN